MFHSLTDTKFDEALFAEPPAEYRGTPLWSWNNRLNREQLFRQIGVLQKMGFGGFHIHPRTGLDTEYLGEEFMELVRGCVAEGRRLGLLTWLYDEDRWPSGFAGGKVTVDPCFRAKYLVFTSTPNERFGRGEPVNNSGAFGSRLGTGVLLARYEVCLLDGVLDFYRRLDDGATVSRGGEIWYAYLETAAPVPWFNGQTYVDTLSRAAIDRFIAVTHETYRQSVGEEFGQAIPAIFTDEPQFVRKEAFQTPEDRADLVIPFTDDLLQTYEKQYGQRLEEHLPEIFWQLPGGAASVVRYRYHDHVCERFNEAFSDTIFQWCNRHNLLLTGHMMEEQALETQTHSLGEAMRSYRSFHIPGIDVLGFDPQFTTAKQAQSAAHQYGRPAVMSELYGITGWETTFAEYKAQGDWQAALGVTVRVPHLSLVSLAGEAKRDYPASLNHHMPWHEEFSVVEDHFARLATVLSKGKPLVRIGVIHPIESFWLCFGPLSQTCGEREEREENFRHLVEWLIFGLADFDFICESTLPSLPEGAAEEKRFRAGAMLYDAVVVPGMRTIRRSTLERLEAFARRGGTLIFAGEIPSLVDAVPDSGPLDLAQRCAIIPYSQAALLATLQPFAEITIRDEEGKSPSQILHQHRSNGEERYVFFCHTDRLNRSDLVRVSVRGAWEVESLDTATGSRQGMAATQEDGCTWFAHEFPAHGHLLLLLRPATSRAAVSPRRAAPESWVQTGRIEGPNPISLSEPNVLLLDQAEYRINGGDWRPREELLRVENVARAECGLPEKSGNICQPWADKGPDGKAGTLELRFQVVSEIEVGAAFLALERARNVGLSWDGEPVSTAEPVGTYVDESIEKVRLPSIKAGRHELVLTLEISRRMNVEWCYVLGDFGVRVEGGEARIIPPVRSLAWGDWTAQGLPFYGGNVTYHVGLRGSNQETRLGFPQFSAPLLSVQAADRPAMPVAFAPHRAGLGQVNEGVLQLNLVAYGSRVNTFGPLHAMTPPCRGTGPWSWRSEGADWSDAYQLQPCGILTAPVVEESRSAKNLAS